jgi:hypothetical protein
MKVYRSIPVKSNAYDVMVRLGAAKENDAAMLREAEHALASIRPAGLCVYHAARVEQGCVTIGEQAFESEKLAVYMQGCAGALVLAATAGQQTAKRIETLMQSGSADAGVVLDAAAAIKADDALGFMTDAWAQANRSRRLMPLKRRFSPGYGDMDLRYQKVLFDMLRAGQIGIEITQSFMLQPDKSVFAICGVKQG